MPADKAQDKFEDRRDAEISQPSHTEKLLSEAQSSAKQLFIKELEQRPRTSTVMQRESQEQIEIKPLDVLECSTASGECGTVSPFDKQRKNPLHDMDPILGTTKAVGEEGLNPKPDVIRPTDMVGEGGGAPTNRFEEGGPSPRPTDMVGEGGGAPTNKFEEGGPSPRPTDMRGEGGCDPTNRFEEGGTSTKWEEGGPIEKPPINTLVDGEGGTSNKWEEGGIIEKPPVTTMMDGEGGTSSKWEEGGITTKCMDEAGPIRKQPRIEDMTLVNGEAGGTNKPPRIEDTTLVVGEGGGSNKPPRTEDTTLANGEGGSSQRPRIQDFEGFIPGHQGKLMGSGKGLRSKHEK